MLKENLTVTTEALTTSSISKFSYLPSFATWLLENKLDEFSSTLLENSRQLKLPLLNLLSHYNENDLQKLSKETSSEFLGFLSENKAQDLINQSINRWINNELPRIDKHLVGAEDINLLAYIRKKTFLDFLPAYTLDVNDMLKLVNEIDLFFLHSEISATNTYIDILKEDISEHAFLLDKVNNTIPGAIYVFDTQSGKIIYTNNKLPYLLGYNLQQWKDLNLSIDQLIHPGDWDEIRSCRQELIKASSQGIISFKYRARSVNGEYKWLRNYESVFKKNNDGSIWQQIGITLNIDKEQSIAAALEQSEERYKQAEAITHIGNYVWDPLTNEIQWSDELFRIHEMEPSGKKLSFDFIRKFNHPDDNAAVNKELTEAIRQKRSFDFNYRIVLPGNRIKILHARGNLILDENKEIRSIIGTSQDVTEKQTLIRKLREKESIYKQAEELANMGNWKWDVATNRLEWTDQLYRIYGLEPGKEDITIEKFLSFVHPEDRHVIKESIRSMDKEDRLDHTFRIICPDKQVKILRSIAQVQRNREGKPVFVIGSERDITDKQNLIDQLRNSEKLYKQAQALAHVGNWTLDLVTNEFTWSDEMYKIYEVSKGENFDLDRWLQFRAPEDRGSILKYYYDCLREAKLYDRIEKIYLPGGKTKVIHRKGEFICNDKGVPVKMIGTSQDITEEYRVQQELKENQTFIRKITDATPSIIASYNINTGKYVFISEGIEKLLGYDPAEVIKKGVEFFIPIIHPEDVQDLMEKNRKSLEEANSDGKKDHVAEFTYRMLHKNGEYRWFHTYGTVFDRNNENKVEHILNISLDVTDQVEASKKIKEQEYFIKQIADASPTILYLYDVEKQSIVYVNREIFFVLGYMPEEIIEAGDKITQNLYHPDDYHLLPGRKQSNKTFQQVDSMMQYECRMMNKENEWRWLLVREIVFSTGENGKIKQVLGAALDINRRKEMEKTILQNTLLLEQSNASLEEFAYVASHDLKEPLRKISTFGDRLVATQIDHLSPDGKIYLNKIVDASQRMQTMINDLLSISMIKGNTSFENFSLQKILEDTLQTLEYKIEQKNAIIKSDPLPEARIIPSQFRQLFQNLLSNSLKFVKDDVQPEINISYKNIPAQEMTHYQLSQSDTYHQIDIVDNGIGFENEFAGKIFAIFQRLHGRSEYEGSGIGLAICKKIIEHHGGIIYASGTPGKGASFSIILPA